MLVVRSKQAIDEDQLANFRGDRVMNLRHRARRLLSALERAEAREGWSGFKAAITAAERHADKLCDELTVIADQARKAGEP